MLKKLIALFKPRYIYVSAETGRFVSKEFAEANPATTFRRRVG